MGNCCFNKDEGEENTISRKKEKERASQITDWTVRMEAGLLA